MESIPELASTFVSACFNPLARIPMWKVRSSSVLFNHEMVSIPLRGFRCGKPGSGLPTVLQKVSIPLRGFRCGKRPDRWGGSRMAVSIPLRGFRCGKCRRGLRRYGCSSFNPLARIPMWKAACGDADHQGCLFQSPCEDSDVESRSQKTNMPAQYVSIPLRGFRCGKWDITCSKR